MPVCGHPHLLGTPKFTTWWFQQSICFGIISLAPWESDDSGSESGGISQMANFIELWILACLLVVHPLVKPPPSENKNLRIHPAESIIYNQYTIKIYSKTNSIQFSIKFPQSQNPNTQTNSYRTKYDLNQRFDCKCPSDKEMIFSLNCKLFFAQIPRAAHHYFPDVFAPWIWELLVVISKFIANDQIDSTLHWNTFSSNSNYTIQSRSKLFTEFLLKACRPGAPKWWFSNVSCIGFRILFFCYFQWYPFHSKLHCII